MPFPWNNIVPAKLPARREEMYQRELAERAALLYRLGYSQARATARLANNVAWDFELHGRPRHAADVAKIVDAVYRRGGGTGFGPLSV